MMQLLMRGYAVLFVQGSGPATEAEGCRAGGEGGGEREEEEQVGGGQYGGSYGGGGQEEGGYD